MEYYPVNLNISGRQCLVVGGGAVASRKIESLLPCGAKVLVVSPEACEYIRDAAEQGRIRLKQRKYQDSDMDGVFMAFAATDNRETQDRIAVQAKKEGVLLNCVDIPDQCDFHVPAKIRRGHLLLAVSTGGGSPALSARIKLRLLDEFGPEYGPLVALMERIRRCVVGCGLPERNNKLFHEILALPLLEFIRDSNWEEVKIQLARVLPDTIDSKALVDELLREQGAGLAEESNRGGKTAYDQ